MGIQYLERAEQYLTRLTRIPVNPRGPWNDYIKIPLDMEDLRKNLKAVQEDSRRVEALNKHTIDMVFSAAA